jgi:hypothetical protein
MELIKKKKRLHALMKFFVIFGVLFIVFYIGAKPTIDDWSSSASVVCSYFCDGLIIANLILVFAYYTKYGKCDVVLNNIADEIVDCGYYLINSESNDAEKYLEAVIDKLNGSMYSVKREFELDELDFSFYADKRTEFIYCTSVEQLDRNDIIAYLDTAVNDITYHTLKRKGNGILLFVTDEAKEDAVSLSKLIVSLGRKSQIRIAIAIAEPQNGKIYYLGNQQSKCQQMIANYAQFAELPIANNLKSKGKLDFQSKLEEKLKTATVSELTADAINIH